MTAPPDQKEAPKGVDAHRGGKADGVNAVNTLEGPAVVKSACVTPRLNSTWRTTSTGIRIEVTTPEGGRAARSAAAPLPCLNRNNCTNPLPKLGSYALKTAHAITSNISQMSGKHGIEKLAFVTLGFAPPEPGDERPDPSFCHKEAQRRMHSLQTHVLGEMFSEMICVPERGGKGGRLHFHLVAAQEHDIRTGVNFEEFAKGVFSSAPKALRRLWAICREKLEPHGFGGWHELMPVKSTAEGISKYVGKYISKQFKGRLPEDKGMRLVRYTRGTNNHRVTFSWNTPRGKLWRWQVGEFARRNGCADMHELEARFPNWSYWQRQKIQEIEPPEKVVGKYRAAEDQEWEPFTLRDVWHADHVAASYAVAESIGCTQGEAYAAMFQGKKPTLEYTVPAFSGQNLRKLQKEEEWERTIVWADGRVERL